jgi:hypothetical protein
MEQLDSQTIATLWFGFDASGAPAWSTGVLNANVDGSFGGSLVRDFGTHFGPDFSMTDIQKVVNGTLNTSPFACTTATAQFLVQPGQTGIVPASLSLRRVSTPLGLPVCGQ